MNNIIFQIFALVIGTSCLPAVAEKTNAVSKLDFPSFRIIAERNIFNPSRSGRVSRGEKPKPVKIETFTLRGTLSYEKGRFAFFDGSSSSFQKVFKRAETIAGFKISEIASDHVKLVAGGKETILRVGSQMKRQDEGAWLPSSGGEVANNPVQPKPSAETTTEPADDAPPTAAEAEVLKKLMQKREQEK